MRMSADSAHELGEAQGGDGNGSAGLSASRCGDGGRTDDCDLASGVAQSGGGGSFREEGSAGPQQRRLRAPGRRPDRSALSARGFLLRPLRGDRAAHERRVPTPSLHDGMAAFEGLTRNLVRLVRNHEQSAGTPYALRRTTGSLPEVRRTSSTTPQPVSSSTATRACRERFATVPAGRLPGTAGSPAKRTSPSARNRTATYSISRPTRPLRSTLCC
jgi:hypothetical protein